jgi:hypothetical protein
MSRQAPAPIAGAGTAISAAPPQCSRANEPSGADTVALRSALLQWGWRSWFPGRSTCQQRGCPRHRWPSWVGHRAPRSAVATTTARASPTIINQRWWHAASLVGNEISAAPARPALVKPRLQELAYPGKIRRCTDRTDNGLGDWAIGWSRLTARHY